MISSNPFNKNQPKRRRIKRGLIYALVLLVITSVLLNYLLKHDDLIVKEANATLQSSPSPLGGKVAEASDFWWIPPESSRRMENQPKRGLSAIVSQVIKRLECPPAFQGEEEGKQQQQQLVTVEDRLRLYFSPTKSTFRESKKVELDNAVKACKGGVPMMNPNEYTLLFSILNKNDAMVEYGSGKSSCIWAFAVSQLHSIEDSSGWVEELSKGKLRKNQMVHWVPSMGNAAQPDRPPSSYEGYGDYIRFPAFILNQCIVGKMKNKKRFDVVLVDGRARPQCAEFAYHYLLREDGLLMIHDFEIVGREHYRIVLRWFELLHLEVSLAIFKKKKTFDSTLPFPSWWTMDQSVSVWNTRFRKEKVAYKEPFEVPDLNPSEEDRKRITKTFVYYQ